MAVRIKRVLHDHQLGKKSQEMATGGLVILAWIKGHTNKVVSYSPYYDKIRSRS